MKFLKFFALGLLILIGAFLFLLLRGCGPFNEHPILGKISLKGEGKTELPVVISRNWEQPWRLQFDGSAGTLAENKVAVFLRNDDSDELKISGGSEELGRVTISPGKAVRIFEGTVADLFAVGKMHQEMTISSSLDRKVNATLTFAHKVEGDPIDVTVSLFFVHFRF